MAPINWNIFLDQGDVDGAVSQFYEILFKAISSFVPLKCSVNSNFPKWFSHDLKKCIREKKVKHRLHRRTESRDAYLEFVCLRERCRALRRDCYSRYIRETESNIAQDPRKFWSFVNNNRTTYDLPSTMFFNDINADNGKDISNLFADSFSSVYCESNLVVPSCMPDFMKTINVKQISKSAIFSVLSGLPAKVNPGPDGIPNVFLKNCIYI